MAYSKRTARKAPVKAATTQRSRTTYVGRTSSGLIAGITRVLGGSPRAVATIYAHKKRVSPYRFR